MSFKASKAVYGLLLICGTILCLSPFLSTAVTGDDSVMQNKPLVYLLVILGLGCFVTASIFARRTLRCPSCGERLITRYGDTEEEPAGGRVGTFKVITVKKCPHCSKDLGGK